MVLKRYTVALTALEAVYNERDVGITFGGGTTLCESDTAVGHTLSTVEYGSTRPTAHRLGGTLTQDGLGGRRGPQSATHSNAPRSKYTPVVNTGGGSVQLYESLPALPP